MYYAGLGADPFMMWDSSSQPAEVVSLPPPTLSTASLPPPRADYPYYQLKKPLVSSPAPVATKATTNWADVLKEVVSIPAAYLTQEQANKKALALAKVQAGQGNQPAYIQRGSGLGTVGIVVAGVVVLAGLYFILKKK